MWIHILEHVFMHTLEDTVKLLPFLFLTYWGMEYLENRAGHKTVDMLARTGKKGPLVGGILGVVPQCGFSAAAANLYAGGVITLGTMVAVFLSTSDEMLPVLISGQAKVEEILLIVGAKVLIGIGAGLFVDFVVLKQNDGKQKGLRIQEICEREHCHCNKGSILKSALVHCVRIIIFIFVFLLGINFVAEWIGMEQLVEMAASYPFLSIFLVGLIGMIPNCAVSVAITTFYLEGVLSLGSMFAGLLSCAGIGIVILFKMNHNLKKNVMITCGIYGISVVSGILMEMIV